MIRTIFQNAPLVLVVDDDDSLRMLLSIALEQEGYMVVEAADGKECLTAYRQYQPDAILLDIVMPGMDGFACCRELRSIIKSNLSRLYSCEVAEEILSDRIPIIILSIVDEQNYIEQAFELGATDYMTKPIHWNVLRYRLRYLLQQALQVEALMSLLRQLDEITFHVQDLTKTIEGRGGKG